jgi:hypothetical protein
MPDLDESEIESITIEARYDPAFALWDKSGEIWSEVQSKFPELAVQVAGPSQVVFESLETRAVVELEAFRVSCRGVNAEKRVGEISQRLLQACSDRLRLSVFKRVGLREIRTCAIANNMEAFPLFNSLLTTAYTENLLSDSKATALSCGLRQENETSGLSASIRTELRETKLTVPWEVRNIVQSNPPKQQLVVFDSDYYTIGTTRREVLNLEDWAHQAGRIIKRYWKKVLQ